MQKNHNILLVINRLGNRCVRVSVFGSKSCVSLAVCGQIWQKILGTVKWPSEPGFSVPSDPSNDPSNDPISQKIAKNAISEKPKLKRLRKDLFKDQRSFERSFYRGKIFWNDREMTDELIGHFSILLQGWPKNFVGSCVSITLEHLPFPSFRQSVIDPLCRGVLSFSFSFSLTLW